MTTEHEETRCIICQHVYSSSLKTSCTGKLQQQKQSALGSSSKEGTHTTTLYDSRTTVASCGRVHTVKLGLDQFSCSSDKRSRSIHPRPEPGNSATLVAEQETLKASAVVRPCLCLVQDKVNDLLTDGVVSACEVSAASSFLEVGCFVAFKAPDGLGLMAVRLNATSESEQHPTSVVDVDGRHLPQVLHRDGEVPMLLGSEIIWPTCQMHVKTSQCTAMRVFPPLFGMVGQSRVPDLAAGPSEGVL